MQRLSGSSGRVIACRPVGIAPPPKADGGPAGSGTPRRRRPPQARRWERRHLRPAAGEDRSDDDVGQHSRRARVYWPRGPLFRPPSACPCLFFLAGSNHDEGRGKRGDPEERRRIDGVGSLLSLSPPGSEATLECERGANPKPQALPFQMDIPRVRPRPPRAES
ncbi:hypothetical protein MRX96_037356 [Rhipicephalus microplus]